MRNLQIFAFGHSITQGFWDTEGGWVQRLQNDLVEKSLEEPDQYYYEVYNLGISGNDSFELLERFESELESRLWPEGDMLILFQIGANDIQFLKKKDKYRVTEDEFNSNLNKLIEKAREYTDNIVFVGETYTSINGSIPWAKDKQITDKRLSRFADIQKKVCEERNIGYIDFREKFTKEEFSDLLEDGSHPNNEGHHKMYMTVKKYLLRNELI